MTIAALALATLLEASAPSPPEAAGVRELGELFAATAADLAAAAEQMPEEAYGYRPTPAMRSFGQILAHVAGSQFLYCAQASGARLERELVARLEPLRRYSEAPAPDAESAPAKTTLVALLSGGIAFCDPVYRQASDPAAAGRTPRARPLLENLAHTSLHYGTLSVYLRLQGLVPPSTARRHAP
jgi:uncharacterized damage-inducible protein DinB